MKNKLAAKEALNIISNKLRKELNLMPLDGPGRTKAHGFAVGGEHGKQFILILGDNEGAKQTRIITEKITGLPTITGITHKHKPHEGSRVNQQKTNLKYINRLANGNQSSFIVENEGALEQLIRWYATGTIRLESKIEKTTETKSSSTISELSNHHSLISDNEQYNDILEIVSQTIEATTKEQLIQARLGQGKFKQNVIDTWGIGKCCAVTGIDIKQLLIASHIIPWRESDNNQRLSGANGIQLCSHLDKLFDQYLISFDNLGQLVISNRLTETDWKHLENIGIHRSMRLNTTSIKEEDIPIIARNLNVHHQSMITLDSDSFRK
jgi:predicted restriction endonuclease